MKFKAIYNSTGVVNREVEDIYNGLMEENIFKEGDTVRLKGDTIGPTMVVTYIYVNKSSLNYSSLNRIELNLYIKTHWFNKSSQTFETESFPAATLIIVNDENKDSSTDKSQKYEIEETTELCKKSILVCKNCGGKNIQTLVWVDSNTDEYVNEGPGYNWCGDCQEYIRLNAEENYKSNDIENE